VKKFIVTTTLGVALMSSALAQNPVSSIVLRPDGNTEQWTTVPIKNEDGSMGTQTTGIIRQSDGSSIELDKQGKVTKISLKENCTHSGQYNATYVCRLHEGKLVQFKVVYLLYSCTAPNTNIAEPRRFSISFENTKVPCSEQSYASDRADAAGFGETLPEYKATKTAATGGQKGKAKNKKAAKKQTTKTVVRRATGNQTKTNTGVPTQAIETGVDIGIGIGGGRERERDRERDRLRRNRD
jgi:hypothetical protein